MNLPALGVALPGLENHCGVGVIGAGLRWKCILYLKVGSSVLGVQWCCSAITYLGLGFLELITSPQR
jgi:hypothetical protein